VSPEDRKGEWGWETMCILRSIFWLSKSGDEVDRQRLVFSTDMPSAQLRYSKHAKRDIHGGEAPTADVDETENDVCSHVRLERRMGAIGVLGGSR